MATSHAGIVNTTVEKPSGGNGFTIPSDQASSAPATRTTNEASIGRKARATRNSRSSGRTSTGEVGTCSNMAMTKRSRTPASMAAAMLAGILSINRASGRTAAVSRIKSAASTKAPTAAAKLGTPEVEAISAAPGVDQAAMIGMR